MEDFYNEAYRLGFETKLEKLLYGSFFDVTAVDSLMYMKYRGAADIEIMREMRQSREYRAMTDLHCIGYDKMGEALAERTRAAVRWMLGIPAAVEVIEGDTREVARC